MNEWKEGRKERRKEGRKEERKGEEKWSTNSDVVLMKLIDLLCLWVELAGVGSSMCPVNNGRPLKSNQNPQAKLPNWCFAGTFSPGELKLSYC